MQSLTKHRYVALLMVTFSLLNTMVLVLILVPVLAINISIWWLDNLLNLQIQLSIIAILLLVINFIYIKHLIAIWIVLYAVFISMNLLPLYLAPSVQKQVNHSTQGFTVAQLNLNYNNPNLQQLLPTLGDKNFDLLVLQEVSDKEYKTIKQLTKRYPYSFGLGPLEATPSGLAIFSRHPITEKIIHNLGYKSGQILEVILQMPETNSPIQVYAIHPGSPRNKLLWQHRNQTLNTIATKVAESTLINKMIIGDFNTSPWSSKLANFEKISKLKNSANGFGYIPSWSFSIKPLFGVLSSAYIDHTFVSESFNIIYKYSQFIPGSDHQLMITELAL